MQAVFPHLVFSLCEFLCKFTVCGCANVRNEPVSRLHSLSVVSFGVIASHAWRSWLAVAWNAAAVCVFTDSLHTHRNMDFTGAEKWPSSVFSFYWRLTEGAFFICLPRRSVGAIKVLRSQMVTDYLKPGGFFSFFFHRTDGQGDAGEMNNTSD